jgi:hypothetical protein
MRDAFEKCRYRAISVIQKTETDYYIKEWHAINHICKKFHISSLSLKKAINENSLLCGYKWYYSASA